MSELRKDPIRYAVRIQQPERHLVRFEFEVELPAGAHSLVMPVWTPGSYKVRDFPRFVRELTLRDSAGQAISASKTRKNAWRFELSDATTVRASYLVYGFEFSVRTNHIDDRHAFINSTNAFFYFEGQRQRPYKVRFVEMPQGWEVVCGLPQDGDGAFQSQDYDELADSPFLAGPLTRRAFGAAETPHEVAVYGDIQRPVDEWIEPFQRIIETEVALFGSLPCDRYVFEVNLLEDRGGGLEHKSSSVIQFNHGQLRKRKDWVRFLSLIAHEYFHLWNGKRVRPSAFEPFDYDQEIYTRSLWVVEGITSYYDELILRRASLISPREYLDLIADHIKNLGKNPGRHHDCLAEASFDAWIKLYQRDENWANCSTSYYEKGQLVALLLDLEIRRRSQGKQSLDDVMRALWKRFCESGGGPYQEREIEGICSELAGADLNGFFANNVHGVQELDWSVLNDFGLSLERREQRGKADLGLTWQGSGALVIDTVLEDGPASKAGLSARDEVIAIGRRRVKRSNYEERLEDFAEGQEISIHVFRAGELREFFVTPSLQESCKIETLANASEAQRQLCHGWLTADWQGQLS